MEADLYIEETERPLEEFVNHLKNQGHKLYLISGGASEHCFGSMGYIRCAAEIAKQTSVFDHEFDYLYNSCAALAAFGYIVFCYVDISNSASILTGAPKGSSAMPTADRVVHILINLVYVFHL